jgi:hypothetical protein
MRTNLMSMQLRAAELRCEYLTNPLGIDVLQPRLSWIRESAERGQRQTDHYTLRGGGLTHAAARHVTPYGLAASAWRLNDEQIGLTVGAGSYH